MCNQNKQHPELAQIKEHPDITTLGQLRAATAALSDDTLLTDSMGEPVMLTICPEHETDGSTAVIY